MKRLLWLCLLLTLIFSGSVSAVAAEKSNIMLEVPKIIPAVRYPMKTVAVPVVIADFNKNKSVMLKSITLRRKGRKLKSIKMTKRIKSVAAQIRKRDLKKILRGRQGFKSIKQANAVKSRLGVRFMLY